MNTLPHFDAVILADGEFPTADIPLQILREAKFLCCCDGAAAKAITQGFMPDAIVGDGDSLTPEFKTRYAAIIHLEKEQDDNDLTKATRFCLEKGFRSIAYLGTTGKREDHTIG
ncbi:MAG: thiamine diphosphokinase, partial [Prevotella sp.]|nr:thiamine diphosphokinase [Prevotella sp.]